MSQQSGLGGSFVTIGGLEKFTENLTRKMKFTEHLANHHTPEWRKQYIRYVELKEAIYKVLKHMPTDERILSDYRAKRDVEFFSLCQQELTKVNLFYAKEVADCKARMYELNEQLEAHKSATCPVLEKQPSFSSIKHLLAQNEKNQMGMKASTVRSLKSAFSEFHLRLVLLQNYQQLNSVGFRKILKKHDELLGGNAGLKWRQQYVDRSAFYLSTEADVLITTVENLFAFELEGGDRAAAMKRLKIPPLSEAASALSSFRLGLYLGAFGVLTTIVALTAIYKPPPSDGLWAAVRLFRGFLVLFLQVLLVGINMWGWQSAGVNHVLIFEFDPRDHLAYTQVLEIGAMWLCIWSACVLAFLYSSVLGVPPLIWPLTLLSCLAVWFLCPLPLGYANARRWLRSATVRCCLAPFYPIRFSDFWLADMLNSLVTVLLDFEYFGCFYATSVDWTNGMQLRLTPIHTYSNSTHSATTSYHFDDFCVRNVFGIRSIVSVLPALIRLLQCLRRYRDTKAKFPHLLNAGKYSTAIFVIIFGALTMWHKAKDKLEHREFSPAFYFWVLAYMVSTTYTFLWDIKMDWGFFDQNPGDNLFLREELIYGQCWFYYFAIGEDLVLRLSWSLNLMMGDSILFNSELLITIMVVLECFRRFIWNFFRLENEHVNNCGQFRAVRDISIRPLKKEEIQSSPKLNGNSTKAGVVGTTLVVLKAVRKFRKKGDEGRLRRLSENLSGSSGETSPVETLPLCDPSSNDSNGVKQMQKRTRFYL